MHDENHSVANGAVDGSESDLDNDLKAKNRRDALRKLGKYAATAPVVTTLLVSKQAHPMSLHTCPGGQQVANPLFCPPPPPPGG